MGVSASESVMVIIGRYIHNVKLSKMKMANVCTMLSSSLYKPPARKTICFSKTELMHDLVIGLFINRYEFGMPV